jgi:DNA-binding NtrC family response regulator
MGTRVLLVDDRREVFECFIAALENLQLTLLYAETEAEARQVFLAQQPQVVILDGWLDPGRTSLDLLHYMRDQGFHGPIIAYTGDIFLRQEMLAAGCTGAWPKPCGFDQIIKTLANLV